MKIFFTFLLFLFVLSSCQHFIRSPEAPSQPSPIFSEKSPSSTSYYENIEQAYESSYGDIPLDSHPDVNKWINYFTGRGRGHMEVYLERSSKYLPIMKAVLKEKGLPVNLVYVALIESGFSSKALSRANAVGYWQFIHGTGKRYNLRIDNFVDERRDFILATEAAAQYFKDLYSLFGSWHLSLAAYNSGEYRVNRAVLRHYNRDFWHLSSKKALPRETRNYIPKLIAAIHISQDPQKYGFYNLDFQPILSYETLEINKSISLKKLASHLHLDLDTLKSLNPKYKGDYVPIYNKKPTSLRIPSGVSLELAQLAVDKSFMVAPKHGYQYHYWYRVRKGDNLYNIARRNKTTVTQLKRENKLGRSSLIRVGQKLKIPSRRLIAQNIRSSKKNNSSPNKKFHVVTRGQSLGAIAKRYGLPLRDLKQWNNIQGNPIIHPGQKLRIKKPTSKSYHLVKKGETLIGIANKYKIPLPKLMEQNSLHFKSVLLTGRKLIISQ